MTTQEKLDILETQEKELVFGEFGNHDALELGKKLADKMIDSERPIAIIIRLGEFTVFQYTMKGKEESHFGWANRKANMVEQTGHSSMYARIAYQERGDYAELVEDEERYAIGCGGFPISVRGEGRVGVVSLSGLVDPADHTVIVETIAEILGRKVAVLGEDALS